MAPPLVLLSVVCATASAPILPPAEVYDAPVRVEGVWQGEVASTHGTLQLESLGGEQFRGMYQAQEYALQYVLNVLRVEAMGRGDVSQPSNLLTFTWQDGHGDRGKGWLLINRDGSALTGSFGRGESTEGVGGWTFLRDDSSASAQP